jgi:hypothetical protein
MTNKNKKRREGYRAPSRPAEEERLRDAPAERPGLLSSVFSARGAGATNMPRVRTSFARGLVLVLSTPALLVAVVAGVFGIWLGALVVGFQGPASLMSGALAMPPIGTLFDLQLTARVFGAGDTRTLLLGLMPFAVARSIVIGVLLGLSVEVLETGRATLSGARRGLLVSPMVLIVTVIEIGFLFVANLLGQVVGQGLSLFVLVAAVAGGLYLLGYAPVAQLREGRGVLESLSRGSRAARIPGTSALALALLYAVPSLLLPTPVGGLGVNPSPLVWVFVLLVGILHVAVLATYAYRWMCIEDEVPEPSAARARARRR